MRHFTDPRHADDYSSRQVEAAHRVLVDLGQVLASYQDCMVLVGGWVPFLLLHDEDDPHSGSIDVDVALDAQRLAQGRYAQLLRMLLSTGRYRLGEQPFQLITDVDLGDGNHPVQVAVEFLAPSNTKLKRNRPKLLPGFRVLQADGCSSAFRAPAQITIDGRMVRGAANSVKWWLPSLPDFLIMKCFALAGRDKPKDAYDLCYVLGHTPEGLQALAADWRERREDTLVARAVGILTEKFASVDAFGPLQVVEFHNSANPDEREMQSRWAFELVQRFLSMV